MNQSKRDTQNKEQIRTLHVQQKGHITVSHYGIKESHDKQEHDYENYRNRRHENKLNKSDVTIA